MRREEEEAQRAVVEWLTWKKITFCAIPNGGLRSKTEAARLKGQGVVAGAPDLLIFTRTMLCPQGVALEMKSGKGRVSKEQRTFLLKLAVAGWVPLVCHSSNEAINKLEALGY